METQAIAEMHTSAELLVGKVLTLTNTRTGSTVTGKVTKAKVSTIASDSPLYVDGIVFVEDVKVDGVGTLDLATPFVSEYALKNYDYYLVTSQA